MIALQTFLFIGGSKHRQRLPVQFPDGSNFPEQRFLCVVPKKLNLNARYDQPFDATEELECYKPRFVRCHSAEFCYFAIENWTDEKAFEELMKAAAL